MSLNISKVFNNFKDWTWNNFSTDPGKMLTWTGAIGWTLSSAAQITALVLNKNISKEDKEFLVPQEMADAAFNILSFVVVTSSLVALAKKFVSTGKWRSKRITSLVVSQEPDLIGELGKFGTDLSKYSKLESGYKPFEDMVASIASITGGVISSNIITPFARNHVASEVSAYHHKKTIVMARPTMDSYQKMAAMKYSSGMRI